MLTDNGKYLFVEKNIILKGELRRLTLWIYGYGYEDTGLPYVVRIFLDDEPYSVFTERVDFTFESDRKIEDNAQDITAEYLSAATSAVYGFDRDLFDKHDELHQVIRAVYAAILRKEAIKVIVPKDSVRTYALIDTVRLQSISTRPDLMGWLHPYEPDTQPYCVELYSGNVVRRFLLKKLHNVQYPVHMMQSVRIDGTTSYWVTTQHYSYNTWFARHGALAHQTLIKTAEVILSLPLEQRSMYYGYSDRFYPALDNFTDHLDNERSADLQTDSSISTIPDVDADP